MLAALSQRNRFPDARRREIASPANPRLKLLRSIGSGRGLRRHERALVCGRRLVEEVVRRWPERIESLVYSSGGAAPAPEVDALAAAATPAEILVLAPALFREVDPFGVEPPLAVVKVEPPERWDPARDRGGITLFLPLGDPENVGAALRSAAAFEIDRVVLLAEAAHPFLPRAIRASAGACFAVELRSGPPLEALLGAAPEGLELCLLDRDGEPISRLGPSPDRGLVVGEEGRGLAAAAALSAASLRKSAAPDEHAARVTLASRPGPRRVAIPISPRVESLNAAVAVGIALWELRRATARRDPDRG